MLLKYLPNIITCLRILLVIPLLAALFAEQYSSAFYLFLIAGISDGVDGFLARRFGWYSRFGSIADPVADKLLLLSMFIGLGLVDVIPWWLVLTILVKDIWVFSGALVYHWVIGRYNFAPNWSSKVSTFLQIILIAALLFSLAFVPFPDSILQGFMIIVWITCMLSMIDYTWVWGRRAWQQKLK